MGTGPESTQRRVPKAARPFLSQQYRLLIGALSLSIFGSGMWLVGIVFQVRELEPEFATAEWGFAIGSAFWGTGVFRASADLVLDFAFETLGVHRLEARAAVRNGRGTAALRKLGAVQEGLLRKSFLRNGEYLDQALYTILSDDWRTTREDRLSPRAHLRVH